MLNNRQKTQQQVYEKKASHGIQTATLKTVAIEQDKNDNNYLVFDLNCETGAFQWKVRAPWKSLYPRDLEKTDTYEETVDTRFIEDCDKLVDQIYNFTTKLFDPIIGEVDNFGTAYLDFIDNLKNGTIEVTEKNYREFGFKRAVRQVNKISQAGNPYTSYELRVLGEENGTYAEDTNKPKYSYFEAIGNKVGDYNSTDFWNSFFEFVFKYYANLKKENKLNSEFVVKLIREKSLEYEKGADGKNLKIDGKNVVKATYYPVTVPLTRWFKLVNEPKFELKLNKAELNLISEYEAYKESASNNVEIGEPTPTPTNDLPF